ncbi:MAG: DedA family protein [Shewanella sp.]|nr:DedA family protein [Shewanella sp.]MCF1430568.1 DedA family protein [Shewanella sp.]MCF1438814.1 DedA family protein [Shewanella sp.]MCF1458467.1 DedA family protein [Shewanella sp.]
MFDPLQHIIAELSPYLHHYGLFILALAVAVEGFGIPAPGQSFLIVSGILATNGDMSLPGVLATGALAAFSGNCIGYFIGLKFGKVLLIKGWVKPETEQKLHTFIGKYGIATLLISRFVEGLKQTLCIGCGIAELPLSTFLLGNALATLVWVLIFGLGPAILIQEMGPLLAFYHSHHMQLWGIGTALIAIGIMAFWLRQKGRG